MKARFYVTPALLIATVAAAAVATRRPWTPASVASASASLSSAAPAGAAPTGYYGPTFSNQVAYIPAQCYATTRGENGRTHNSCFVCHQEPREPNYTDDSQVQAELSFARYATRNRWTNLQAPPPPSTLSDAQLLDRVRSSNYLAGDGGLTLARALAHPLEGWDHDHDGAWAGFVPDCFFHVDESGFDRDPSGKATGWRSYAYLPIPGLFLPTNGSFGDAFIRLPEPFRVDAQGNADAEVYRVNLAIVEAYVKRSPVRIAPADERKLGADLDGNGALGTARHVAFVWPAKPGHFKFVGKAAELDPKKDGWPVAGLYPRGTEFLHSVRYLDVVDGTVRMAARMKELRYMRKTKWLTFGQLDQGAQAETREKLKKPDKLKSVFGDLEHGVSTGVGWVMQGFIESADGDLRPQNFEETTACIGCHGGVGATTDATFSFARKLPAGSFRDGWYHPSEYGLKDVPDPKRADGIGEYERYLTEVGGGDDFRSNDEIRAKFFRADGSLEPAMARALARDVSVLLLPSPERALALDRAYLGLVSAQRFERGRDVLVGAPPHFEREVAQGASTGIESPVVPSWKRPLVPRPTGAFRVSHRPDGDANVFR